MRRILLGLVICMVGCTSATKVDMTKVRALEQQIKKVDIQRSAKVKVYTAGALDALQSIKKENQTEEIRVAIRLLDNTQKIIGVPQLSQKLDVAALINKEPAAEKALKKSEKEDEVVEIKRAILVDKKEVELEKVQKKLENAVIHLSFIDTIKLKLSEYAANLLVIFGSLTLVIIGLYVWNRTKNS